MVFTCEVSWAICCCCCSMSLLLFRRFDQQRGQAAVVDALRVLAVLVPSDDLGDDCPNFFGDHSHFMFAVGLQFIGDAAQLLDLRQRAVERLNVGLPAARAVGRPAIGNGRACALGDGEDIRGASLCQCQR